MAIMGDPKWIIQDKWASGMPWKPQQHTPPWVTGSPPTGTPFPTIAPTLFNDVPVEQALMNQIQQYFDSGQISEELYTKLMQALLDEADNE